MCGSEERLSAEEFTGKQRCCKYTDGTEHYFLVAKIDVNTPYYRGITEALCIGKPLYDLVIGNIPGVKYPEPEDEMNAVQTRAQKQQETKPYRKLNVRVKILDISEIRV